MKKGGFILAGVLALLVSFSLETRAAWADEVAQIYDPGRVFIVDLTLSPTAEAELEADPDEDVEGTFSLTMTSDGTPAGGESILVPEQPAEIHLKGSVGGSFRALDEKPGFKVKFKKTETVLGLRKMTLNNMVQDPSMVHETLAYATFRAAGLPASRTGFAYVRLNDHDIGVYLDLESLDDIALAKIFGSFDKDTGQHLYEGEQGDDVVPGDAENFDVDEGNDEPGEQEDLDALIEAVNGEGREPWSDRVDQYADLGEMTRFWAVEKYIDHWDGYSGHASQEQIEKGERPNNYYLYSDPSGRFQMLPWGTDQAWVFTEGVPSREVTFDGKGGVLFNKCLEDKACFRLYWEALGQVTETMAALDPGSIAEDTAALLEPWQVEERANGRPDPESNSADKIEDGVDETLAFAAGRRAEAEAWLAENKPPEPELIADEGGPAPPAPLVPVATLRPPAPRIVFERVKWSGRLLTTRVRVSAPGQVSLRATFRDGKKQKRACSTGKSVEAAAGELVLRCKLSDAAMKKLAHGPLRLRLRIVLVLADGSKQIRQQKIKLTRD